MRRREFITLVGGAAAVSLGGAAVLSTVNSRVAGVSIQVEILRLALRRFVKRGALAKANIAECRRSIEWLARNLPRQASGTKATWLNAGGVPALRVTRPESRHNHHVFYLHGGGYVLNPISIYRDFLWRIAGVTNTHVLFIDYRLAPEHPFPAAVDDAVAAYRWLLAEGADPQSIAMMGDSAGGGLALATLLRLRDEGVTLPAAAVMLSPWTDLAMSGESSRLNAEADPMLDLNWVRSAAEYYLAGVDPRNPYASPLYGDPTGLPPSLIQVGGDEILLDDSVRMANEMRGARCHVELQIWTGMPHVWQLYAFVVPESRRAIEQIGAFVHEVLR